MHKDIDFQAITVNSTDYEKKQATVPESHSMLEDDFSLYADNYFESPFSIQAAFNHAPTRRAQMKQTLPDYGPWQERTFRVPEECPGPYFKRFSNDGRVS